MEKELLEKILNELNRIETNTNNSYPNGVKLDDIDEKLGILIDLLKKQVNISETIANRLENIRH